MLAYFCALVKAQFNKTHRRKLVKLNKKCGNKLGIYPRKIQRKIKNSINSCAVMIDSSKIVSYLQGQLFRSVKQIGTPDRALSGVPIDVFSETNMKIKKCRGISDQKSAAGVLPILHQIRNKQANYAK